MKGLAVLFLLPVVAVAGQYHVCTDENGKKSFQTMPCNDADQSEVREYEVRESLGGSGPSAGLPTDSDIYKQMKADNRRAQLKRDIKKGERAIDRYQKQMSGELAALRARKARANNNLAGATWEQSISAEMQAVSDKYGNLIGVERDRLTEYRRELSGL
ncbi:hypothetical protein [Thalassolituus sp.]|uniref:hypothetical protein n=1 Tax=Thalassolituus sp. TaxID=2030822 RepID=UPI00262B3AC6|nr:hypothetical protein [Thalassolituus sp.]